METSQPQEKIIVFRAYDTVVEANLAKTKLDAYGIPCFITDENLTSLYPIRNGIFPGARLHIFEKDREEAVSILDNRQSEEGFIKCPHCGSYMHEPHISTWEKLGFLFVGIFGLISASKAYSKYRCKNCNHIFSPAE